MYETKNRIRAKTASIVIRRRKYARRFNIAYRTTMVIDILFSLLLLILNVLYPDMPWYQNGMLAIVNVLINRSSIFLENFHNFYKSSNSTLLWISLRSENVTRYSCPYDSTMALEECIKLLDDFSDFDRVDTCNNFSEFLENIIS